MDDGLLPKKLVLGKVMQQFTFLPEIAGINLKYLTESSYACSVPILTNVDKKSRMTELSIRVDCQPQLNIPKQK